MHLSDFDHLRFDKRIKFKEEVVNGNKFIIICYMIADTSLWSVPLALEARGITFNADTNEIVSRPFEKFFSVNENEWTQDHQLPWNDGTYYSVYDKIDGSLVTPVLLIDDSIVCKTKKSFHNDIARKATEFVNSSWKMQKFCFDLLDGGLCPIFEYTHPDHRIVIDYGKEPTLSLLAIRCMKTGHYHDHEWFDVPKPIKVVKDLGYKKVDIERELTLKGKEGFVVYFPQIPLRVKMKSEWYLSLHRIMTVIRPRDVAEAVVNETIDDLKASIMNDFSSEVDIAPVLEVEKSVVDELNDIRIEVEQTVNDDAGLEQKDFAIKWKSHEYFPLMVAARKGVDIVDSGMLREWFRRKRLKDFGLEAIYNKNF